MTDLQAQIAQIKAELARRRINATREEKAHAERMAAINIRIEKVKAKSAELKAIIAKQDVAIKAWRFLYSHMWAWERHLWRQMAPRDWLPERADPDFPERFWTDMGQSVVLHTYRLMKRDGLWPTTAAIADVITDCHGLTKPAAQRLIAYELARPDTPLDVKIDHSGGDDFRLLVVEDQSLYEHLESEVEFWEQIEYETAQGELRGVLGDPDPFGIEEDRRYRQQHPSRQP